jgi:antitoxin (DNA-binding transcriptional repressor) of toxin-antitoxin stability system
VGTLKTVGIRKLKNSLSAYLREVRGGAVMLITDRGRVVAEMRPPSGDYGHLHSDLLEQEWIDSNKLRMPEEKPKKMNRMPIDVPPGTTKRLLDLERTE